ncbi:MAG: methyltransferase domain-containing protein [Nanoarchaeota archaeon]|nr:methyltransferase domain-containing protein [Nanoarchaeota archaeon]
MKRSEKDIEKWWNDNASGFQRDAKISTKTINWGVHTPYDNKLKLLTNVKGKKIIEVGCGGGQISIFLAKKGANCTGIDLSEKELDYAKNLAKIEKVNVNFLKGSFQDLSRFKKNSFDIAVSSWAFQYSPNLNKLFKEVYKIIKPNGIFIFSMPHPFYEIMDSKTHKIKYSYFKTGRYENIDVWQDGSKHKFVGFHVKVSDIYNALIDAGFYVEKIIEPVSLKDGSVKWEDFPKELSKLIGPSIIFKTRK